MIESIFYAIILLLAMVLADVIHRIFPKLALPLIQVVFGLILGAFGAGHLVHMTPEVLLGFIIAPLIFRESEESDVKHIFRYIKTILWLILPLVFITTLGLGYLAHALYVGLPLAACFALGASLAPTDAIAVNALSGNFKFPKRIISMLTGEGLLNDASGIITFQMAATAMLTGAFSLQHASIELVLSVIGGLFIGGMLVWLKGLLLQLLEDFEAKNATGYLILELIIPLAAFLIADLFEVSGIIAVVTAGALSANGLRKNTAFDAQVAKVKHTIWDMLVFILNSVVFLFLGVELYDMVVPLLVSPAYSDLWLIAMVLALLLALFAMRFAFLNAYYWIYARLKKHPFKLYWNDILLLSFAGSKGTISIATILMIPRQDSVTHSLLIFLAASVTGLSFLTGLFVLPFFAKKKSNHIDNTVKIELLTQVVLQLREDFKNHPHSHAHFHFDEGYDIAIDHYQARIQKLIMEQEITGLSEEYNELYLLIIRLEIEGLDAALRNDEISEETYRVYQRYLRTMRQSVMPNFVSSLRFGYVIFWQALNSLLSRFSFFGEAFGKRRIWRENTNEEMTELYFKNTALILQTLENLKFVYDDQLIDFLQAERIRNAELVADGGYIARFIHQRTQSTHARALLRAYYLERKAIFDYEEAGKLTPREAKSLRANVNMLEDYYLDSPSSGMISDFLEHRER